MLVIGNDKKVMKTNRKTLFILSPNDRYNYGDLLFSYIIKYKLKDYYDEFVNIATIDNDLTKVGGEKVHSLSYLYNCEKNGDSDLMLAGGESLMTDWVTCYKSIYKSVNIPLLLSCLCFIAYRLSARYGLTIRNYYGRRKFAGKTKFPYSISKDEIKKIGHIFYNSIGGISLSSDIFPKSKIRDLQKIDYIAVRDEQSFNVLKGKNVIVNLVPDTAILLSEVFPLNDLEKNVSKATIKYTQGKKYMVFQINKKIGEKKYKKICESLRACGQKLNIDICLCPIGYAPNHDDPEILKKMYQELGPGISTLFGDNTIWDIMYLIAKSSFFIGTSLHGVITAMSYAVPYLGLYGKKTQSYIKTWGIDLLAERSLKNDICEVCDLIGLQQDIELNENRKMQMAIVNKSFDRMKEILQ